MTCSDSPLLTSVHLPWLTRFLLAIFILPPTMWVQPSHLEVLGHREWAEMLVRRCPEGSLGSHPAGIKAVRDQSAPVWRESCAGHSHFTLPGATSRLAPPVCMPADKGKCLAKGRRHAAATSAPAGASHQSTAGPAHQGAPTQECTGPFCFGMLACLHACIHDTASALHLMASVKHERALACRCFSRRAAEGLHTHIGHSEAVALCQGCRAT